MNEQQAVAVRDPRDPFSQALSLLFKEAKNPRELKEKYRAEMAPLVTQVAFKIGAIDTEKSISERAIPVFAGVISMYLMEQTKGEGGVEKWSTEILSHPFSHLFRRGYTLIHDILKGRSRLEVRQGEKSIFYETTTERIEAFATHREEGMWAGYALYADEADGVAQEKTRRAFADWLVEKYKGREVMRKARERLLSEPDGFDYGEIIRKALYNVCYTGKPSLQMDFRRARDIVDGAQKNKRWFVEAQKHLDSFVAGLPQHFRDAFFTPVKKEAVQERGIHGEAESVLRNLQAICTKKFGRLEAIDDVCVNTGVPPPILGKTAKAFLGDIGT